MREKISGDLVHRLHSCQATQTMPPTLKTKELQINKNEINQDRGFKAVQVNWKVIAFYNCYGWVNMHVQAYYPILFPS